LTRNNLNVGKRFRAAGERHDVAVAYGRHGYDAEVQAIKEYGAEVFTLEFSIGVRTEIVSDAI
jgi:uncharacterized FAD-dependent dehydrogenase